MPFDRLRRREFITLLGGAAATPVWPITAGARQSAKLARIGFVGANTANDAPRRVEIFRAGLRELGYQEGRNIVIEFGWADGRYERLPALFKKLVRRGGDVIVTHGTPIVTATSGDALVASLARPSGNVTGSPALCR